MQKPLSAINPEAKRFEYGASENLQALLESFPASSSSAKTFRLRADTSNQGSLKHHYSGGLLQHSSCIMYYWLFCAVTIYVRCIVRTPATLLLCYSTAQ